MKRQRDEIEIEFRAMKEKKDRLENEKKKILKTIKIGNDYVDLFSKNVEIFNVAAVDTKLKAELLQDKLVLIWCAISLLPQVPAPQWLETLNTWIDMI